jgi:hypothetical protein
MRLRPLSHPSWHISISLTKWSAKLRVPLASSLQTVSCVIVIGDGVPEDIVCLILAHRFNGGATIGITKPQTEWGDAVTKIVSSTRTSTVALIIDQDNVELSELWNQIEDKLKEHAVSYERKVEEERFHAYDCKHGQYSFRFPVVVNGLNKPYRKHTIEDHLLEASKKVLNDEELRKAIKEIEDPKEAWRKLKDKHHKIYSYLLHEAETNLIMEAFPQHIKLFEFIKGHSINIH